MGKSTGFLEYERVENAGQEPLERIKTYREFHTPLSDEERRKQVPAVWTAVSRSVKQASRSLAWFPAAR